MSMMVRGGTRAQGRGLGIRRATHRGITLTLALPLTVVLAVAACASSPDPGSAGASTDSATGGAYYQEATSPAPTEVLGVVKDPETWALPLDPLFASPMERLRLYAHDLLAQACMAEAGFNDYEILTTPSAPYPATRPHGNGTLFNVAIAQAYGYRMAPDPGYKPSWEKIDLGGGSYWDSKPAAFREQLDRCNDEIHPRLFGEPGTQRLDPGINEEDSFLSRLNRFTVDTSSPELQAAASQWRDCMAPQGIADLPEEPWTPTIRSEMPPSLQTRFDYHPTGDPSADEIAVATADAQCRESSGWTHLLYEATWDQQAAFITAHQTDVDAFLAREEETAEKMRQIITEAGGTL